MCYRVEGTGADQGTSRALVAHHLRDLVRNPGTGRNAPSLQVSRLRQRPARNVLDGVQARRIASPSGAKLPIDAFDRGEQDRDVHVNRAAVLVVLRQQGGHVARSGGSP